MPKCGKRGVSEEAETRRDGRENDAQKKRKKFPTVAVLSNE